MNIYHLKDQSGFSTKLWYYTENYTTSIYEEKKHGRLPNTKKLDLLWNKLWKYTK